MAGMTNTHASKIIDALGGTAQVARLFDVRMASVSDWKQSGIPRARMMYLKAVHPKALKGIDVKAATAAPVKVEA
jgi:hypothetical protein